MEVGTKNQGKSGTPCKGQNFPVSTMPWTFYKLDTFLVHTSAHQRFSPLPSPLSPAIVALLTAAHCQPTFHMSHSTSTWPAQSSIICTHSKISYMRIWEGAARIFISCVLSRLMFVPLLITMVHLMANLLQPTLFSHIYALDAGSVVSCLVVLLS